MITTKLSGLLSKRSTNRVLQPVARGNNLIKNLAANWYSPRSNSTITQNGSSVRCTAGALSTFGAGYVLNGLTVGRPLTIKLRYANKSWGGNIFLRVDDAGSNLPGSVVSTADNPLSVTVTVTASTMYVGFIATAASPGVFFDITLASAVQG